MSALSMRRIKAAVSHPSPLLAAGIRHTLSREPAVDETAFGLQSLEDADVILTDHATALHLAAGHAGSNPRSRRARLAIIASTSRESEVRAALEAGIEGYLLTACTADELVHCIRVLASGSRYLSDAAMRCVADSFSFERLTTREAAVLALMAEGMGNKAIANRLEVCVGTVKSHVKKILDKLGASNRTQAVSVAMNRGLVSQRGGAVQ